MSGRRTPALLLLSACAGGPVSSSATNSDATTTSAPETSLGGTSSATLGPTTEESGQTEATSDTHGTEVTGEPADPACPVPESLACDIWEQDCCEGEKCNPWGSQTWNAARCVPVDASPDPIGAPCTVYGELGGGYDSCEGGSICWQANPDTLTGTCVALCQGSEGACARDPYACCSEGYVCQIIAEPIIRLCIEHCDPLKQDCLDEGQSCYPNGGLFSCRSYPGTVEVGAPCSGGDCIPGSYCGHRALTPNCPQNSPGCCIQFCSLSEPSCPENTECAPWYPEPPHSEYEEIGSCVIAP